jgi:hypothetical protein
MITILNQTPRFLRIHLSRGKVLRLGPGKEGQISTHDAAGGTVKQLVADGAVKIMGQGPQAGASSPANPAARTDVHGHHPRLPGGRRGDR